MYRLNPYIAAIGLFLVGVAQIATAATTPAVETTTDEDFEDEGDQVIVEDVSVVGDPEITPGFFEGDIELPRFRNAIRYEFQKWPSGTVYYTIDPSYSSSIVKTIKQAMKQIEDDTKHGSKYCVRFLPKSPGTKHYASIRPLTGCHSNIGMVSYGSNTVSIGQGCQYTGIVMHELLHALGFYHEQSRKDRDQHVGINLNNVNPKQRHNFNKQTYISPLVPGSTYDFNSIMHYGPYSFAVDGSSPTIWPKGVYPKGIHLGQRTRLSAEDVSRVQKLYKCTVDTSHIVTPPKKDLMVDCDFESDNCQLQSDSGGDFQWTKMVGPTPSKSTGPGADSTNGVGSYLYAEASGETCKVARVKTPLLKTGDTCIAMSLYDYGRQAGTFSILVEGSRIRRRAIRTFRDGTRQHRWQLVRLNIRLPSPARFYLESRVGSGPKSDVAIDDVQIYHGKCTVF